MKILMLGDSPFIKTGFGIVNAIAFKELSDAGHELLVIGGQDTNERDIPNGTFFPVKNQAIDSIGWTLVDAVVEEHAPDAVHIIGDPATVTSWLLKKSLYKLRITVYMPVEGAPLNQQWVDVLSQTPNLNIITCSNYGVEILRAAGLTAKMAYHGVSSDFAPMSADERDAKRYAVGWNDKFVIMCVAQNVERKQWGRLFEAVSILSKKYKDVILYAHTVPFNNYYLGGHNLPRLAVEMGISDRVFFPQDHKRHNDAIELRGVDKPGLIDLYNMADVFVLTSQVEGFGLPLAEAMACGLPVMHTNYGAGAEVIGNAGVKVQVNDWTINKSHSRYANVSPAVLAEEISRVRKSAERRNIMSKKGIEQAKKFKWDDYQSYLREAFNGSTLPTQQESDQEVGFSAQ
jgi:glycosyltransferase involved in cell wall biosynthesis